MLIGLVLLLQEEAVISVREDQFQHFGKWHGKLTNLECGTKVTVTEVWWKNSRNVWV
jgi:hypothetical protein